LRVGSGFDSIDSNPLISKSQSDPQPVASLWPAQRLQSIRNVYAIENKQFAFRKTQTNSVAR
jgi:hypothetical protein